MDLSPSARTRSSLIILALVRFYRDGDGAWHAPGVFAGVLAFDAQFGLGGQGIEHKVVVAVRAVLVAACLSMEGLGGRIYTYTPVFELACVLAESLLALLADKGHLVALSQLMVGGLMVALGAVEPLAAWVGNVSTHTHSHTTACTYSRARGWLPGR